MKNILWLIPFLFLSFAWADTPPPNTVKAKTYSGDGLTAITATGTSLNVNVTNSGGTSTVNQGTQGSSGSPWWVSVTNTVPVSQSGSWTAQLLAGSATIGKVDQGVGGVSAWKVDGSAVTQPISGSVSVSNFPATQAVTQSTSPWVVSGTVAATQSGTWTVQQGTPPWTFSLPTGASTSALQTTGNTSLSSIDSKIPANLTVTSTRLLVDGSGVTQPISAGALPLPSGASTSALQTTGNSSLSSIDGKLNSLGQKVSAASVPVVIASDQSAVTVSGTVTATNSANGATGAAVPAQATQVGGSDGTNLRAIKVSSTGVVSVDGSATTQPVNGTVTANAGTGNFNENLAQVNGVAVNVGTGTASTGTQRVAVATDSQITVNAGTNTSTAALATSANQTNGSQKTQHVDGSGTVQGPFSTISAVNYAPVVLAASATPGAAVVARSIQVAGSDGTNAQTLSTDATGKLNINNISGTLSLPSGAATETSLAKLTQTQGSTTSGQSGPLVQGAVTTNNAAYTTAQTSPLSLTVRGGLRTSPTGMLTAQLIRNDYSTTNVTTAAYVQLVASTTNEINRLLIFDSSGQDFVLATGAAASEVDQIRIPPGGWDAPIDLVIPSGTRISIKASSATASSGILIISGLK